MLRAFINNAILLLFLIVSSARAETDHVARVAMSVGDAAKVDASGRLEPLKSDSVILPGDRIITGKDSMAILVFVDQGRVSLRGDSEIVVHRYRIDPSGADTQLELELVRGSMRQISGEAARLQPERYRLNTPVAAIGVRGTDFLAKTSSTTMETYVHEGMIVVLPSDPVCAQRRDCRPLASLSGSDAGQYLAVMSGGNVERRSISPDEVERLFGIRFSRSRANPASGAGAGLVFVAGADAEAFRALNSRDMQAGVPSTALPRSSDQVPSQPAPLPRSLVWGRFSAAESLPSGLLLPYEQARSGRHVTVGELGQYALWRADPAGRLDKSLSGRIDLSLAGAETFFVQPAGVSKAELKGAYLGVDFDRATFSAGGVVSHQLTGDVSYGVKGSLNDQGMFWAGNASERVAGALSRDGREAGYLFTKQHSLGTFQGMTLWSVR